ncbi:hypothetical protein L249_8810, partial [Ophiocordyceps polyrhachis-furcata BCC 54312]
MKLEKGNLPEEKADEKQKKKKKKKTPIIKVHHRGGPERRRKRGNPRQRWMTTTTKQEDIKFDQGLGQFTVGCFSLGSPARGGSGRYGGLFLNLSPFIGKKKNKKRFKNVCLVALWSCPLGLIRLRMQSDWKNIKEDRERHPSKPAT